ncbi:MAG: ABC transporter permease [Desulfomonilaceae bacterium]|nr:ABC transporter permease [Desulfomonilaceae bacterium]
MSRGVYVNATAKGRTSERFLSLLWALVVRDVTSRYRRSSLGMWWAVLQPLILMLLFNMLRGFVDIPSDGMPYVLFSYSALVPWTFFTNAISSCGPCIINNAEIIKKIALPREVFPLAAVVATLFDFAMSSIVLACMMVWFNVPVGRSLLWIPVLVCIMTVAAFAVGSLLAGLGTFRRDFTFATPFLTQAWLFVTPVIYPLSTVPEKWRYVYMLNPMVGIVEGFRNVLIKGAGPPWEPLVMSVAITGLLLAVCRPLFRRLSEYFADVL